MARKGRTENKSRTPSKLAGVRVIALEEVEGHGYGAEFEMPKGAKLDKLIADGKVRIDNRMPTGGPAPSTAEVDAPAPPEAETK